MSKRLNESDLSARCGNRILRLEYISQADKIRSIKNLCTSKRCFFVLRGLSCVGFAIKRPKKTHKFFAKTNGNRVGLRHPKTT